MRGPYLLELEDKDHLSERFREIGCDPMGVQLMINKAHIYPLLLKEVKSPAANALKQHMLSLGGDAVVGKWVINVSREQSDVLLLGTIKQYQGLVEKLAFQPWGLKDLGKRIKELYTALGRKKIITWQWKDFSLTLGERTHIMGILNVTPDSFSDGGKYLKPQEALMRAREMVEEGARIIDVGGESTRPHSQPLSVEEELERIIPILELLLKEIPVPISLDTYKSQVARAGLALGVHIINDVGMGTKDPQMVSAVAEAGVPVIIMHNPVNNSAERFEYRDVLTDCLDSLAAARDIYINAGINEERIVLDPGIGFGKNAAENLKLIQSLRSFKSLGSPLLLGASRKSFIGHVLGAQVDDRLEGSLAVAAWGVMKGVDIIRVHDVRETVRAVRMLEAIEGLEREDRRNE